MVKRKNKEVEKKNWKKELSRDFLALGSLVFYILVIARAIIKPYRPFVDQLIIAGILLIFIGFIFRRHEWNEGGYIGRGLVLVVFTILFYEDKIFTGFAIAAMIGLIYSSYNLNKSWKNILRGLLIGSICSVVSYCLVRNLVGIY